MAAAGHACGGCRETIASADCLCERHSGIRMPELTKEGIFHCVYAALNDPTYRFADHKERVIDLLARVTRVSVETVRIVAELNDGPR